MLQILDSHGSAGVAYTTHNQGTEEQSRGT